MIELGTIDFTVGLRNLRNVMELLPCPELEQEKEPTNCHYSKPRENCQGKILRRVAPHSPIGDIIVFLRKNLWKNTLIRRQRLCYSRLTRSEPAQPARTRAAGEPPRAPLRSGRAARTRSLSRRAHLSEATVQILETALVHFYPLAFPAHSFLSSPLAFPSRL
jgi:hypothetical protein